jgi:hypothetical protein
VSTFLFTTLPSNDLGLLTRSLPIARELRELGHEVLFCSPGVAPRKLVEDAGFEGRVPDDPLYHKSDPTTALRLLRFLSDGPLGRTTAGHHPDLLGTREQRPPRPALASSCCRRAMRGARTNTWRGRPCALRCAALSRRRNSLRTPTV